MDRSGFLVVVVFVVEPYLFKLHLLFHMRLLHTVLLLEEKINT